MPTCPQCDNRQFSNKEALLQHLKSSGSWHPFCGMCDNRRFVSNAAYDAHMAAKHPPTSDCIVCDRKFKDQDALNDHYRGSPVHPNCPVCGVGSKDAQENEEHHRTTHVQVPCTPCGVLLYENALVRHYTESPNHPNCTSCRRGFKDEQEYIDHFELAHPELRCQPCGDQFETAEALETHFSTSAAHPKCGKCRIGLQDDDKLLATSQHMQETHPLGELASLELNDTLYSTGFTPLSPRNKVRNIIIGEKISTHSPILRLSMNFASPIKEVAPVFSPIPLPKPDTEINEEWATRDNQARTSQPILPSKARLGITRPRSESDVLLEEAFSPIIDQSYGDKFSHQFTPPISPKRPLLHLNTQSTPSAPTLSRRAPLQQIRPMRGWDVPPITSPVEFHPRLYPGSARAAAAASRSVGSMHSSSSAVSPLLTQGPPIWGGFSEFTAKSRSLLGSPARQIHEPESEHVDWDSLLGDRPPAQKLGSSSVFSDVPTPKRDTPPTGPGILADNPRSLTPPLDVQSLSSAASSFTGLYSPSAYDRCDSRPTTVSSLHDLSSLGPIYKFNRSDCSSPRSPEVTSPIGLAVLPQASPFPSTPSEYGVPDFPEARRPLPESPSTPLSPIASVPDTTPSSPSVLLAPIAELVATGRTDSAVSPVCLEYNGEGIDQAALPEEQYSALRGDEASETDKTLVVDSSRPEVPQDRETADIRGPGGALPEPTLHLHCRECKANPCEDLTATMCGHIFCYRCITEAVIKTSSCPVCSTPTLLYCLFRLDLNN